MRIDRHQRQFVLFLVAILVPAGALIGLAGRILYQDRELAAKRAVDQRRAAIAQVRRELASRLEAIKLQEINRLMRSSAPNGARGSVNPAVLFTGRVEEDRLVLPWQAATLPDDPVSRDFARHRQAGEAQEFVQKDFGAAAEAYRLALASARHGQEGAEARLALARALLKSGKPEEASQQYRALLNEPAEDRDEQGVGFRFYAAERLLAAGNGTTGHDADAVRDFLSNSINGDGRLTLPELYMIRSLLGSPFDVRTEKRVLERIAEMEQAEALAKDFPRVHAQIDAGATAEGSVWVPYGKQPWLVTIASPQPPLPGLVMAVSPAMVVLRE